MLEKFLTDRAAVQRRRTGLFGLHLDTFVASVSELGYARATVREQLWLLGDLERWLQRKKLAVADLDQQVVTQFLQNRRRKGRRGRSDARTVRYFLEYLREKGAIQSPAPTIDESPLAMLRKQYENYLRKERGLSPKTVARYWVFLEQFLVERFGTGPICLRELVPDDISGFLLRHARSGSPTTAQLMVSSLRSFFRYLFCCGETESDLAGAVPRVPAWRLAEVPKYLKPEDVERVINACDRSTCVGCRDHALILLLARLGLRAGEVIALELDDINWRAGVLTVRGKGRYHDRLPLPHDVGRAIANYLRQHRPPHCTTRRVFIRSRAPHRGFAHPSSVSTIVCRALKRAGLQPDLKGAHLLRHSLATGMLRRGASMAEIGEILRHRVPNTTEIYAKVDVTGLRSLALPWPTKGGAL
jgi:site-specific recombinase XerD